MSALHRALHRMPLWQAAALSGAIVVIAADLIAMTIPNPWFAPRSSVFRISNSSVPCRWSARFMSIP